MKSTILTTKAAWWLLASVVLLTMGCGEAPGDADNTPPTQVSGDADGHDHSGWWCVEHGIPEEECGMCNAKVAADFKAKSDWCQEHNRPQSQCFICDPALAEQYIALYEAKYGTTPPKPTQ